MESEGSRIGTSEFQADDQTSHQCKGFQFICAALQDCVKPSTNAKIQNDYYIN